MRRQSFYPFLGGLDQTTQAIAVPRGRCIAVKNYESVDQGYARVGGFERYDGHPSPTDTTTTRTARDAARALISAVPGSGPVRGVYSFNGKRYAWRDNNVGTGCGMFVETPTGWVSYDGGSELAFTSGGTYEMKPGDIITGATSGATATLRRVLLRDGTWADGDGVGSLVVGNVTGTFVAENLNVGANMNVATIATAPVLQGFPAGGRYQFITHNFYGSSNLRRVYGVNGVGRAFEFDETGLVFIVTGMPVDAPTRVASYKQHLFLSFPGGSLQFSDVGEPTNWNPTIGVGEIGIGDEITDFISNNSDALIVLCASSVAVLTGSAPEDFALQPLSEEAGAIPWTAQRVGTALYLDNRGVRSLNATQAYGNFKIGTLTPQIQPTLDRKRRAGATPTASTTVRTKSQYRMFYDDGSGFSLFFGRKDVEAMLFDLGRTVTCICTADDPGTSERIFFGASNGFVYELDKGTSFDGAPIEAYLQLPFNNEGGPYVLKRWHKAVLELVAAPETKIGMATEFDYAGGDQGGLATQMFDVMGGGGLWSIASWDDFYWSAPVEGTAECWIDGQGKNMSAIIASSADDQVGHILQGITNTFSVRGQAR